ncbi:Arc family DNA-binding protein [Stenotrophomonas maltophilia]|uniref:Arc family DNA-binding protein n=1 Tax=Stenotrophomonas maltophilia TaxID=40324 RepID=UPI002E777D54|nr:Arc family DNA-binding protein [Stenotrophomonas maltophilia]
MSRDITPFPVRLSRELRERLDASAKEAGRSLNAEIVQRLEASFGHNKRTAFELLRRTIEVVTSSEASLQRMHADIDSYEKGDRAPLAWLVAADRPRDDKQVLDAARQVLSLIEKDVATAKGFVPALIQATKDGGPIPEEIHSFLAQA